MVRQVPSLSTLDTAKLTCLSILRPFWLSPRQIVVIPVAAPHKEYAKEVAQMLWDAGLYADADLSDSTLPKKVRNGEIAQYNYIFGAYSALSILE